MMHKKLLFLLLPAIAITGCGKKDLSKMTEIESLEDISEFREELLPSDSMMYYFGKMQASAFWQDAESDTLLRSEEARKEFMNGFRAAARLDEDNAAYNKGLQLGLRLAIRLREFSKRYGMDFSSEILAASLQNALKADMRDSIVEAQKGFYLIKDRLDLQTAQKETSIAKENLAQMASARGFVMVSDTLYALDVTPSQGNVRFKDGDRVAVEVSASTLDGKEIVARQFPDSLTIGEGRVPRVVCLGIHTMTNGQTRSFMTTPRTLFGKRYATYHLPYDEPVIFTVKAARN